MEQKTSAFMDIVFDPAFKFVDHLRQFLYVFCSIEVNQYIANNISFTAHELVENAIKYSCRDDTRIRLTISSDISNVVLEVTNYAILDNVKNLQKELDTLLGKSDEDLMKIYLEKIASSSMTKGISCLGLTRILFEWKANLSCNISDTDDADVKKIVMITSFSSNNGGEV